MTTTLTPDRPTFRALVAEVAAKARASLPEANGRVDSAIKLVLAHDVAPQPDGSTVVGSSSDPLREYHIIDGNCDCQDATRGQAPSGFCQHKIAAGIYKRVQEQLPPDPEAVTRPAPEGFVPPRSQARRIPAHHLQMIHGTMAITFEGLLDLAHTEGLIELRTTVVQCSSTLAVCEATAVFRDGRHFTDIADATPDNVKPPMKHAFIRMAATRAAARALRRALNISTVAVDELGEDT